MRTARRRRARRPCGARRVQACGFRPDGVGSGRPRCEIAKRKARYTNRLAPFAQPMSNLPALEVSDLVKTYPNGVQALKGVSLSVQPGDFYALLGPNGAGKSTLIGIVSSLVNASAGDARVFGVSIRERRSEAMQMLGLVPQEINFNMFEQPFQICLN